MKRRWRIAGGMVVGLLTALMWLAVTGSLGLPLNSARAHESAEEAPPQPAFSVGRRLSAISPAIPLYPGADFRNDLSSGDLAITRATYGSDAEVFTLVSQDGFPMVWHYYVTYLAQFRGWKPDAPFPLKNEQWRTLQLDLNQVMRDPFIPGTSLEQADQRVILEVQETGIDTGTVIRYIVVPELDPTMLAESDGSDTTASAAR